MEVLFEIYVYIKSDLQIHPWYPKKPFEYVLFVCRLDITEETSSGCVQAVWVDSSSK